jgi:hypothetical protein
MFFGPEAADPDEESLGRIPSEAGHDAEHVVELLKAAPRQCAELKKLQLRRRLRAAPISSMCRFCQSTQWPYVTTVYLEQALKEWKRADYRQRIKEAHLSGTWRPSDG